MISTPRAPVSDLFLGVSALLAAKKVPVAIAILTFAMLLAVGSSATQFRAATIEDKLMSDFSMKEEQFRETVETDLAEIAKMDVAQFMQSSGFRFGSSEKVIAPIGAHQLGFAYVRHIAPIIALQTLFNLIVIFISGVFFLVLFTNGTQSPFEAARKLPLKVFSMVGLFFWLLIRSLIWIPLVGPALALYMLPRLSLAPVYLASGEATVFSSIKLSQKRTSGHWFTIVLRLLLISIVAFLILWPMLVLVVGATLLSVKFGFILLLLALVFSIAYQCAALTVLAVMMA